jgi:glycosyltransferase involved in cell wall biosynthesis
MNLSVVIPTLNRPNHLARCLGCLREQTPAAGEFEVIVVLDGPDPASETICNAFDPRARFDLRVIQAQRRGIGHTKNVALDAARASLLILLNDDVRPHPAFLEHHASAHAARNNHPAMVLGHSPWVVPPADQDRIFDRLLRETSMVFFYDRMINPDGTAREPEGHDWGFRHAWNLNLSLPTASARAVGGFDESLANCCYEDVEFARRFTSAHGAPVLFRPEARAEHDHRYEPADYLKREFRLGYSAWGLALSNPDCAREVFRRDLTHEGELARCRDEVDRDNPQAPAWRAWFESLAARAQDPSLPTDDDLQTLYQRHLPLKRHEFRKGLLAASEGRLIDGLFPAKATGTRAVATANF